MRGLLRSKAFVISAILLTAWLVLSLFQFRSLPGIRTSSFLNSLNKGFTSDEEKLMEVRQQLERERRQLRQREEQLNRFLLNIPLNTPSSNDLSTTSLSARSSQQQEVRWDPATMEYQLVSSSGPTPPSYKLLLIVLTSLEHFEERRLLRDRWSTFLSNPIVLFDLTTGRNRTTTIGDQVKIRFVMGDPRLGPDDGRERGRPRPTNDGDEDEDDTSDDDDELAIQRRKRKAQEERERREKEERLRLEEEEERLKDGSRRDSTLPLSTQQLMEKLHQEQDQYGDLIAIRALADGYYLLAERMASIISILSDLDGSAELGYPWLTTTKASPSTSFKALKGFQYLMKVDDDSYVLLGKMLKLLETLPSKQLYWGMFHHASKVETEARAKWYNPEYVSLNTMYPNYAAGGAYLLSRDLVEWIGRSSVPMKVWKGGPEDSQVGTWLSVLDIERSESGGSRLWNYRCAKCTCETDRVVAIHGFDKEALKGCFEAESTSNDICQCPTIQQRITDANRRTRVIRTTSRGEGTSVRSGTTGGGGGTKVWTLVLIGLGSFFGCAIFGGCLIYIFILVHREVQKLRKLEKLENDASSDDDDDDDGDDEEEDRRKIRRGLDGFGFGRFGDESDSSGSDSD